MSDTARYRSAVRNISADKKEIMRTREAYAEMIMNIDEQIGRIVSELKSMGIYDSTSIIFSADHGDMLGDMEIGEKGPFLYESQLGIPMILAGVPGLDQGTRSELLVGNIDIPGTVLDIAGSKRGLGYSKSMRELVQRRDVRTVNFSEFCDSIKTVENGRYRFSYYPFENYSELYDREEDPKEITNLSGRLEYATIENKFLKEIIEFGIMAKGVRVEAQDLVPAKQEGMSVKNKAYLDDFPIVFPLPNMDKYNRIKAAGLNPDYNEFCKGRKVLAYYGKSWEQS